MLPHLKHSAPLLTGSFSLSVSCLAHEAEDVFFSSFFLFYSFAVFARQPVEKAAHVQLHLDADTQSLNSFEKWMAQRHHSSPRPVTFPLSRHSLPPLPPLFFFTTRGCMKYLRALRTLLLWVWVSCEAFILSTGTMFGQTLVQRMSVWHCLQSEIFKYLTLNTSNSIISSYIIYKKKNTLYKCIKTLPYNPPCSPFSAP